MGEQKVLNKQYPREEARKHFPHLRFYFPYASLLGFCSGINPWVDSTPRARARWRRRLEEERGSVHSMIRIFNFLFSQSNLFRSFLAVEQIVGLKLARLFLG
jgi:hypothetical protein